MKKPFISIITTSLDRKELLRKTLKSVLSQSWPAVEQIVVDGVSKDGTVELLRDFEEQFAEKRYRFVWVSEPDSGQGEAMNKGLRGARGDFAMILNSDDFLFRDSVAGFMGVFMSHPEVDVVYGNHETLYEDGRCELIRHRAYSLDDVLRRGYQIPQSAAVFRRSLIDRVGGFDESLRHVAEHDLFLRMMKSNAKFLYIPLTLQVTLEHGGRKTTAFGARAWRETKKVNFKYGGSFLSPFYALYLKNVYFQWFWEFMKKSFPRFYIALKRGFYKVFR